MRSIAGFALLFGMTTLAAAQAPWSYVGKDGPLNWGKLDPAYRACSQGKEQSPIDIHGAHLNKALTPLEFHFVAGPVTLENTGNLIVAHIGRGTMTAAGVQYQLQDLVFHHPSEHSVKGKLTDMDVDMMFKSADGKPAALSVRLTMDRGEANATIAALWEHLPAKTGQSEQIAAMINAGGLLPRDRSYYTYTGSLTTPPCTEGVRWFVLEQDLSISREQLRQFAAIFRVNSRPRQDDRGRKIEAHE